MWGDYQVDNPNTLSPDQQDTLINQAKLIAGITAAFAGEDVTVAAGVAAEAVRNNSTRLVTTTIRVGAKLVKIAVKQGKITIGDLKKTLKDEGFGIVDNLITITDGYLNIDDAKAIINLVIGTELKTANQGKSQEKIQEILMANNPVKFLYNGIKNSPNYPVGFTDSQNGTKKHTVKNQDTLNVLRTAMPGEWHKVYKDGYLNGKKVSIHYFQHKSDKVFDVKVKDNWSNQK